MTVPTVGAMPRTIRSPRAHSYGMGGVLRSEWTKMRTVRSTVWTIAILVLLAIGLAALATAETTAHWSAMSPREMLTFDPTRTSLIGMFFGQFVLGVLGVLIISAEYGTGTIRATFAAAPRRPLVLVAKVVVFGVVALVVSEAVSFIAYFLGQALLVAPAHHTAIGDPGALRAVVGAGLYLTVIGLFALALGAIIRHTAGGISAFVGVLLVLPIIVAALPSSISNAVGRYLPANIGQSIVSAHIPANSFAPWTGFGILCGYTVGLLLIAGWLLVHRDA